MCRCRCRKEIIVPGKSKLFIQRCKKKKKTPRICIDGKILEPLPVSFQFSRCLSVFWSALIVVGPFGWSSPGVGPVEWKLKRAV